LDSALGEEFACGPGELGPHATTDVLAVETGPLRESAYDPSVRHLHHWISEAKALRRERAEQSEIHAQVFSERGRLEPAGTGIPSCRHQREQSKVRREARYVEGLQPHHAMAATELHRRARPGGAGPPPARAFERMTGCRIAEHLGVPDGGHHVVLIDPAERAMRAQRGPWRPPEGLESPRGPPGFAVPIVHHPRVHG